MQDPRCKNGQGTNDLRFKVGDSQSSNHLEQAHEQTKIQHSSTWNTMVNTMVPTPIGHARLRASTNNIKNAAKEKHIGGTWRDLGAGKSRQRMATVRTQKLSIEVWTMSALVIPMFFGHLEPESNRIQSIHRQRGHRWTPYDTCQCWRFAQLCSVHSVHFCAQVLQVAIQTFVTVHRKQLENDWRNNSPYLLLVQHTCKTDWSTSDCHSSYILVTF